MPYTTTTVVTHPDGSTIRVHTRRHGGTTTHTVTTGGVEEAVPPPAATTELHELTRTISSDPSQLAAVSMIQRNYRGYRDMRESELGFMLRKKDSKSAVNQILKLWGTGEERPSGAVTVAEQHRILEAARAGGGGVTMRSGFGHSVLGRVANLGKGITETENPMLLAQHQWLESTDERHRYGCMLFEYYALWAVADTTQSFFFWLDYGDGKTATVEEYPRSELEAACVRYCNKQERLQYVVQVVDGKLCWVNQGMKPVNSAKPKNEDGKEVMMIYVMAPDGTLYVGDKKRRFFHHSSFLSGSTVIAAGSVRVEQGVLQEITPHSGHYRPSDEDFKRCIQSITDMGVPMEAVAIAKPKKRKKEKNPSALVAAGKAHKALPNMSDEEDAAPTTQ
jgi:hypothetical protein